MVPPPLQLSHNSTVLHLEHRLEGGRTVNRWVEDCLSSDTCQSTVQEVHLGPDFLDSLSLAQGFFVLEELGEYRNLQRLYIRGQRPNTDKDNEDHLVTTTSLSLRGLTTLLRNARQQGHMLQVLHVEDVTWHLSTGDAHDCWEEFQTALQHQTELQTVSFLQWEMVTSHGEPFVTQHRKDAVWQLDSFLQTLCCLSQLTVLHVELASANRCTFDGNALARLFSSTQLLELHLSHIPLTKMHLRMLAWAVRKDPLQQLSLKYGGLGDDDLTKLCFYLGNCRDLQQVDFTGNEFGNVGCTALAESLAHSTTLSRLSVLDNPHIGPEGYASLAKLLHQNTNLVGLQAGGSTTANPYRASMKESMEKNQQLQQAVVDARNTKAAHAA
uniref:Uncharacterized protein n=1 Tax=Entomoneis paludosa TaxID=265537 RepID=A0A7S2Y4L8_9STRA|mmetsp:Transcript_16509/g.34069  ORF Transcript_16509/g.34069 Transcript_16509/m.34069 type:complete len:383 (+) Transcript_16509:85-1233(+)